MAKFTITAPDRRFSGEFAGLVFRAGKASAETPADLAAVTYCRRRGYTVDAAGEAVEAGEPQEAETAQSNEPDPDDNLDVVDNEVRRPADYASKADWVTYAVAKGATEEDAQAATKNELIELYG